jgi:hypothetical protein
MGAELSLVIAHILAICERVRRVLYAEGCILLTGASHPHHPSTNNIYFAMVERTEVMPGTQKLRIKHHHSHQLHPDSSQFDHVDT